jgi:hypothetical protein
MKGLLNKYTFEFLDIQTNKVETKKYSNVLSNKEFLKIRFENLKSLKIKTYSLSSFFCGLERSSIDKASICFNLLNND